MSGDEALLSASPPFPDSAQSRGLQTISSTVQHAWSSIVGASAGRTLQHFRKGLHFGISAALDAVNRSRQLQDGRQNKLELP